MDTDAVSAERQYAYDRIATLIAERDAALAERDKAIRGHWVEETCADCHNVFIIRHYHCVTCSSERLNTLELATARADRVKVEAALTEARRVLREASGWLEPEISRGPADAQWVQMMRDVAAVLAQEEPV